MLLLGLSTGHKVGLALAAAGFAGFSLIVSMLVPRWRPQFPGRGLPLFLVVCVLLLFGMLTAVFVLGKESESKAAGGETTAQTTTGQTRPTVQTVQVSEVEFKIHMQATTLKAGKYTIEVKNDGKIPHDLSIKGTGDKTKLIPAGGTAELKVTLKAGKYELYCSVPGHEAAGMKLSVTVS